jgi:hypothetical protein
MQIKQSSRPMRIIHYFALAWLGLTVVTSAQTTNQIPRPMSLQDCINLAVRHNLDVQIQRYNPEISRYTLDAIYGSYDRPSPLRVPQMMSSPVASIQKIIAGSDTETDR